MAFSFATNRSPDEGVIEENMEITPAIASDLLKKNNNNRKLRPYVVEAYARDILNGEWSYTGEAIKLDKNGNVLDGQHRLSAVIAANKAFYTKVISNLPAEARDNIDTGIPRNAADVLRMDGGKYNRDRAAIIRQWIIVNQNYEQNLPVTTTRKITISEIKRVEDEFGREFLEDAASATAKLYANTRINRRAAGTLLLLAKEVGRLEEAVIFLRELETGTGLHDEYPPLTLRNSSFRLSQMRLNAAEWLAYLIITFNKTLEGKKMARMPSLASIQKKMAPSFPRIMK